MAASAHETTAKNTNKTQLKEYHTQQANSFKAQVDPYAEGKSTKNLTKSDVRKSVKTGTHGQSSAYSRAATEAFQFESRAENLPGNDRPLKFAAKYHGDAAQAASDPNLKDFHTAEQTRLQNKISQSKSMSSNNPSALGPAVSDSQTHPGYSSDTQLSPYAEDSPSGAGNANRSQAKEYHSQQASSGGSQVDPYAEDSPSGTANANRSQAKEYRSQQASSGISQVDAYAEGKSSKPLTKLDVRGSVWTGNHGQSPAYAKAATEAFERERAAEGDPWNNQPLSDAAKYHGVAAQTASDPKLKDFHTSEQMRFQSSAARISMSKEELKKHILSGNNGQDDKYQRAASEAIQLSRNPKTQREAEDEHVEAAAVTSDPVLRKYHQDEADRLYQLNEF